MKRCMCFILVFLIFCANVFAQNSFEGQVVEVAGITITAQINATQAFDEMETVEVWLVEDSQENILGLFEITGIAGDYMTLQVTQNVRLKDTKRLVLIPKKRN